MVLDVGGVHVGAGEVMVLLPAIVVALAMLCGVGLGTVLERDRVRRRSDAQFEAMMRRVEEEAFADPKTEPPKAFVPLAPDEAEVTFYDGRTVQRVRWRGARINSTEWGRC